MVLGFAAPASTLWAGDPPSPVDSPDDRIPPIIEIVSTPTKRGDKLRIEALVTSDDIRRVDFLLDGEPVGRDRRFPFGAVVEPTDPPALNRLVAVALDREGREVARDVLILGAVESELSVSVSDIRELENGDWLEVSVDVQHSPSVAIDRVDFYRDERYVASVSASPYRTRIPGTEGGGYLRAVALTHGGELAEGIHLLDQSGEDETLSVSLIELYAMVTTRAGSPVTGLRLENFELFQGNRRRPIERFSEGDSVPLSLALVIDSSGSMYEVMGRAKQSAREFLQNALDEGDEVLLVDFNVRPRLLQAKTDDVESLVSRFDQIRSRGGSAVYDAILFGSLQLEGSPGRKALVVLTDGLDSGSRIRPEECAEHARRSGVPVFVLSLGLEPEAVPSHRSLALQRLAMTTGGSVHEIRRQEDISAAYDAIEHQLRGQYLLGFSVDRPLSTWDLDSLTVGVSDHRLRVRTILGGQVRVMH